VRITVSITDTDTDAAVDPGTLKFVMRKPSGTTLTYTYEPSGEVIKDATGRYHVDLVLDEHGTWDWRWEAGVPYAGAIEGTVRVQKGRFA
jgi:hypothetical protein